MPPNSPDKHHYLPIFYLKRWAGPDSRVCEFSRPYRNVVKPRRVHPAQTGFVRRLYSLRGFPPHLENQIESSFFRVVDSEAAHALKILESGKEADLGERQRSAWSRFIMSLLLRMPEDIEEFRRISWDRMTETSQEEEEEYKKVREIDDPETFSEFMAQISDEEFDRSAFGTYLELVDNPNIGAFMNNMNWVTVRASNPKHEFFCSDRPVIMSNGLAHDDGHIALPIGPQTLFLAATSHRLIDQVRKQRFDRLVSQINMKIVGNAVKYAYATSDKYLRFAENRLGVSPQQRIIHRIERKA